MSATAGVISVHLLAGIINYSETFVHPGRPRSFPAFAALCPPPTLYRGGQNLYNGRQEYPPIRHKELV